MTITNSLTRLAIVIDDIADIILSYDQLLLYRSVNGVSGTYAELTASSAVGATLKGVRREAFSLNGKPFIVDIDGTQESFTFGAVITAADAAVEITANTSVTAVDDGGYVRITSPTTGTASTLEFTSASTGAVALGFYQGDNDHGEEDREALAGGTKLYTINDYQGSSNYWYKTRYYNTSTLSYSDYSSAFQGREEGSLDPSYIIYGTGYLTDLDGTPVTNTKVFFYNKFVPKIVNNKLMAGMRQEYTTDSKGYVYVPLIKGSTVSMAIENTRFQRDITVPSTGDTFDLMTTDIQDAIGIVEYDIPDATRTTI